MDIEEKRTGDWKIMISSPRISRYGVWGGERWEVFVNLEGAVKSKAWSIEKLRQISNRIFKEQNRGNGRETILKRIKGNNQVLRLKVCYSIQVVCYNFIQQDKES